MVSTSVSGLLLHYFEGWHSVFYFFGTMTLIWCVLFAVFASDTPTNHPFISVAEKEYLQKEVGETSFTKARPPTPWSSLLTSVPVIALVFAAVSDALRSFCTFKQIKHTSRCATIGAFTY